MQSSLVVQATQALSWQRAASGEEQSSVALQATHWLEAASQTGVSPSQAELSSAVHWTQVLLEVSQTGVEPLQWERLVHSTQSAVSALQTGVAPVQEPSHASEPPAPAAPVPVWPLSPACPLTAPVPASPPPAWPLSPDAPALPPLPPLLAPALPDEPALEPPLPASSFPAVDEAPVAQVREASQSENAAEHDITHSVPAKVNAHVSLSVLTALNLASRFSACSKPALCRCMKA